MAGRGRVAREPKRAGSGRKLPLLLAAAAGVALALAVGVLLAGGDRESAPTRAAVPQDEADLAVTLASGERFSLSAHRGQVIALSFLGPGCPSCAEMLPALSRVAEDFKERGVVVLVLDVGGLPPDQVASYYRGLGGGDELRYAADEGLRVARRYGVRYLGTTLVIGRDGSVAYRDRGDASEETVVAAVRAALQ